jgi:hypothetical protein
MQECNLGGQDVWAYTKIDFREPDVRMWIDSFGQDRSQCRAPVNMAMNLQILHNFEKFSYVWTAVVSTVRRSLPLVFVLRMQMILLLLWNPLDKRAESMYNKIPTFRIYLLPYTRIIMKWTYYIDELSDYRGRSFLWRFGRHLHDWMVLQPRISLFNLELYCTFPIPSNVNKFLVN